MKEEKMNRWERKRQSIWCAVLVVIGILLLYIIYRYNDLHQKEIVTATDVEKITLNTQEEQQKELDIEALYTYREKEDDIKTVDEVAKQLVASHYLVGVELEKQAKPYKIILSYDIPSKKVNLSKIKKDQIALCNATALLCIFDEIDTIAIELAVDEINEEKVIYRPDIEDYFKLKELKSEDKQSFDRLVGEFLNTDKVTLYNQIAHPYSSQLGKDVEKYFKWYFPPESIGEPLVIPSNNEEMEKELEAKYGYQFYLEGLKMVNSSINYYCINKLRYYYNSPHVEEILIELVACRNRSENKQVRLACDRTKEILAYSRNQQHPLLFTLFDQVGEAHEIYIIKEQSVLPLAKWEGNNKGSIKIESISPNGTYALCRVETEEENYRYTLPMKLDRDSLKETYILKEEGALLEGNRILPEMNNLIIESNSELGQALTTMQDAKVFKWLEGPFIKVGEKLIYDCKNAKVLTVMSYQQDFGVNQLTDILSEQYKVARTEEKTNKLEQGQALVFRIENESIVVYQFETEKEKEQAIIKNKAFLATQHYWSKGKIIVIYNGESSSLRSDLDHIFKN